VHLVLDAFELVEKERERHTIFQRYRTGTLYDGTVGQRVAERDAHLDHVDASPLKGLDDVSCALKGRTPGTEIE
jgi:hypothetical protein